MLGLSCGFDFVGCKQFRDVKLQSVSMDNEKTNGSTGGNPFTRSHEVIQDTSYRMWNPVSMSNDGLLLLNPSNCNVHCNGSFSGGGSKFPFLICFLSFLYETTWK